MKILYSWLKEFVDFKQTPQQLADDLSMFAHEVETVKEIRNDAILDLEITPNRGDCLSTLGIARQIAAMYDLKLNLHSIECDISDEAVDKKINVQISDPNICPRFTARIIDHVKIQPSPEWMQKKLESYGFRPINNIVDVTNYVMIATGQPMHAFDFDKIKDGLMKVRLSKENEQVQTLDGKNHTLPKDAIIIEDEDKIYDLAGIMGGNASQVTETTKTIILQGAIFDSILIRRASKNLHHQTDASYRYERGVDYEGTVKAVNLAASLILESSKGSKISSLIDIESQKVQTPTIMFSDDKINHLIGTNLKHEDIVKSLERLYFKVDGNSAKVPSFRFYDVSIWQDLAEEVARIYGYNNIERIAPEVSGADLNPEWQKREIIKDELKNLGLTEIYSYSFADKDKIEILGYNISDCIEIINPISPETRYLRPSLLSSLLSAVAKNPWSPEVNIFEIEKVFDKSDEKWQLGIAIVGKNDNLINKILNMLDQNIKFINIDQNVLASYKIRRPIKVALVDLDQVTAETGDIDYKVSNNQYRPISKYPPTIFDLAFIVDASIASEEMEKSILNASSGMLFSEKFDEFVSDKLGQNNKSVAFHIWLQNMSGPVTEAETKKIRQNIIKTIEQTFNAKLRS